jgi:hypothetical protein
MMEQNLLQTTSLLARTPASLNALLHDLPEAWTLRDEGENTWTVFEVVGHLVHCEHTNWIPRAEMILQSGESQPFAPLDRTAHTQQSQGKSLNQLLEEFARLRSEKLVELRELNLQPQDLERRGRHPALGTVTLSQLLAAWATHDLTHLHQISRIMAHQYQAAVGP